MRFMLLLHHPEADRPLPGTEAFAQGMAAFAGFHEELARRGIAWEGHPLQWSCAALSVRVRDGEASVTPGSPAEVPEQLGGYYVLDLPSEEAAVEVAALVPWAQGGTVEVRPVMELAVPAA
jgi:hypothetical protein